jgi:hypothetical protein
MRLFHAPYPYGFLRGALRVAQEDGWGAFLLRIGEHLRLNVSRYFDGTTTSVSYTAAKYLYLLIAGVLVVRGLRSGRRLAVAAGLVVVTQWLALCLFYDAFNWRDLRTLGPFLLLGGLTLVECWPGRPALGFLLVAGTVWLGGIGQHAVPMIDEHQQAALDLSRDNQQAADLAVLAEVIPGSNPVTVLLPRNYLSDPPALLSLPVRSAGGAPIRYTINRRGAIHDRHGHIAVDYALLPPGVPLAGSIEVLNTPSFRLVHLPPLD